MTLDVRHDELKTHLKLDRDTGNSPLIKGGIGIGKSQVIKEQAEETAGQEFPEREFVQWSKIDKQEKAEVQANPEQYFIFLDIRLSQYDPTDIKGLPDLDEGTLMWKVTQWVETLAEDEAAGTIFFDEVNLAPPNVQAAFYQLVLKKEVSNTSLSDDVNVVAAGNRAGKDRANVYEMAAPLRDRFVHMELMSPVGGAEGNWVQDYAIDAGIHPDIVSYIAAPMGSNELDKFNNRSNDKEAENLADADAFPTPRSWEVVSDMFHEIEANDYNDTINFKVDAAKKVVGEAAATKLRGFLELNEQVDIRRLLANPENISELDRVDLKYSVITGIVSMYKDDKEIADDILDVALAFYNNSDAEYSAILLNLAMRQHSDHMRDTMKDSPVWDDLGEKINVIL